MPREKEKLSREEREARKRRQEELKKIAVKHKSRQLNALFRLVAMAGFALMLLALSRDMYASREMPRSGYTVLSDVIFSGQAYERTNSAAERFQLHPARLIHNLFALLPFLAGAFFVMYAVDFKAPLGRAVHVAAMIYVAAGWAVLIVMTNPGGYIKTLAWPGVEGTPVVRLIVALFIAFVGALTATPGAPRRVLEAAGATGAVPLQPKPTAPPQEPDAPAAHRDAAPETPANAPESGADGAQTGGDEQAAGE